MTDCADVPVVGSAAAAENGKVWQQSQEFPVLFAEFHRIAIIERLRIVELLMAHPGCVCPEALNALCPVIAGRDDFLKMIRWAQLIMK